jgi:hypothetical protein
MANLLYNIGLRDLLKAATAWEAGTYKCALVRSTSTYTPNKDDTTFLDQSGLILITVASYATQTIGTPTVTANNSTDLAKISCADIDFGSLEAGQTVKAAVVYRDDGSNGVPLAYIDTDAGSLLPRALGGGDFKLAINAAGFITVAQT